MEKTRKIITKSIITLPLENISIHDASGRITAEDICAKHDIPFCDESLRDGYVVPFTAENMESDSSFPIVGEIAAGTEEVDRLLPGSSCRIYTGGVIPEGGGRVVPYEKCDESDGIVRIAKEVLQFDRLFIRRKGSEIHQGDVLVCKGTRLCVDHLVLLVSVGIKEIPVYSQPRVVCFCTGSELLRAGNQPVKGKKISTNSFLLESMMPLYGGVVDKCTILPDDKVLLKSMFDGLHEKQVDVVISTGGMGPGKYDLVQDAFCAAGGEIILNSLPMRPGKSILLGKLKGMYFIALPGPPHAVRTLLTEFVGPIVLMLQGASVCWPESFRASLEKSCRVRLQKGVQVKSGLLSVVDGRCLVRLAKRLEVASCNIFFAAGREDYKKGDLVEVHPWHTEQ